MDNCSKNKYLVISVMGPHAGESEAQIFNRKISDTKIVGRTFWLVRSYRARPEMVQRLCEEAERNKEQSVAIFIQASSSFGATPTKIANAAKHYSTDGKFWKSLPEKLSPVTGKIGKSTYALVFDRLELVSGDLDLWDYADFFRKDQPVKIFQGASTLCAIKKDMSAHPNRTKSHYRKIVAIGNLCHPYCVWVGNLLQI